MTETPAPDLRALRELAEAARDSQPRVWDYDEERLTDEPAPWFDPDALSSRRVVSEPDSRFIAAANPTAILALIERVEAAEAAVERVLALVDEVTATFDADLRNPHTERAAGLAAGAQALADDIRDALDAEA